MADKISDIQGVVLDVDGTLCSLTKGVGDIYADILASMGISADAVVLRDSAKLVWEGYREQYLNVAAGYQTNPAREREVWLEFARRVLRRGGVLELDDEEKVVRSIYDSFASGRSRQCSPGVEEFLRAVRSMGLRTFAATNNDSRSSQVLAELGLLPHLDGLFVAGDVGWKKPSVLFFTEISRRVGLDPRYLLHVGNDPELDFHPAVASGWKAVLYDAKGQGEAPHVRTFDELAQMVTGMAK